MLAPDIGGLWRNLTVFPSPPTNAGKASRWADPLRKKVIMKIWKFSTCDECGKKIERGIQFKVKGQSFGGVVLCVDCIKSAQQMLAVDVAECVCENRHIGEDHICENCGGVA